VGNAIAQAKEGYIGYIVDIDDILYSMDCNRVVLFSRRNFFGIVTILTQLHLNNTIQE
jgi:hypothetical protein